MGDIRRAGLLGLTGYHWVGLAAAWLGWGFDVFDALLFNFVAPDAVPTLLHMQLGSVEARRATVFWTGALTSIRLVDGQSEVSCSAGSRIVMAVSVHRS